MSWNQRIRWLCLGAIFLFVLIYLKIDAIVKTSVPEPVLEAYFVNKSGCQIRALDPFSKTALSHLKTVREQKCPKLKLLSATASAWGDNKLVLSMSKTEIKRNFHVDHLSSIYCDYKVAARSTDFSNYYTSTGVFRLKSYESTQLSLPSGSKVVRVQCFSGTNQSIYHDVHFFLPPPPTRRIRDLHRESISVMIIGIDSVSHMHFKRTMPRLNAFVKQLPHVEFWGYNRVGRNSYPNLVPMLSGLNVSEFEALCYTYQRNFDSCPLIWRHFEAEGYSTTLAEDTIYGTFNYGLDGFSRQPTNYYMRPLMVEINKHTRYSIDKEEVVHCTAARKYYEVYYEFLEKMLPYLRQKPSFSMFWQTQGVHDFFNYAQLLDSKYLKIFMDLVAKDIMENTVIFLMSDHGIRLSDFRATYQGMLEESQPLLIAIYPKWLKQAFPLAVENLEKNSNSLITTFDLHATFNDLMNKNRLRQMNIEKRSKMLKELDGNKPRGISLFLPIPDERDCKMAGIPLSFCLCQTFSPIASDNHRVRKVAYHIVASINRLLTDYDQCQRLRLDAVLDAYILDRGDAHNEYKVQVRTIPGEARFEGTVTDMFNSFALNGPILRINRYGNQSYCAHDVRVEMYCYCQP